jgi:hypothetical protein
MGVWIAWMLDLFGHICAVNSIYCNKELHGGYAFFILFDLLNVISVEILMCELLYKLLVE